MSSAITLTVDVHVPIQKVWETWTQPVHIANWNNIDDNWHTPLIEIDLREGGHFLYRMETRDGAIGFDHKGVYEKIVPFQKIGYILEDGRKSIISFEENDDSVRVSETFQPEKETPWDEQKAFCQAILKNFKAYAELIYAESMTSKTNY